MPKITSEGSYSVKIVKAWIKPNVKDETVFEIVLQGQTPDGFEGYGSLYWNRNVIKGGRDQGKTNAQKSQATLESIGVPDGYPPNLPAAIDAGLECQFSMKWEENDKGEKHLKCAFINPVSRMVDVHQVDWGATMKAFETGKPASAAGPAATMPAFEPAAGAAPESSPFNSDAQSEPLPF